MEYNYAKLLGKITEMYGNNKSFANALGISERTLSLKLNNKIDFKQKEIIQICKMLKIPESSIRAYFFNINVQNV